MNTPAGLARAFRQWAVEARISNPPDVSGASASEARYLGALGGVARAIADERIGDWPLEVRAWAERGPAPPEELLEAIRQAIGTEEDPLAVLYEASISAANRRRLGTVFTPRLLVDHMVELAAEELDHPPACVIDPGAGVGAFTIAAARRWPDARVVAVDINVVTLGLLAARLAFEADDADYSADVAGIELLHQDYLDALPALFDNAAPGPALALGNPPYTRVQELPSATREKAAQMSEGIVESGHANLAILFQAATLARMRDEDVSCMVLPGSLSYTHASSGLRRTLWRSNRAVSVSRTRATTRAFAGRSVQAAVVLIGAEQKRRQPMDLARVEIVDGSLTVFEEWKQSRTGTEPGNWFWAGSDERQPGPNVRLSDTAIVRRGIATGANELFFLTDAQAEGMPKEVIVPAVPTLRGFSGKTLDSDAHKAMGGEDAQRWLLSVPPDYPLSGALGARIREYESEVKERHLPSKRKPWYSITDLFRPQILLGPLSKSEFRIVLNEANAVPSNNLFGISMRNGGAPAQLADWLRSDEGQAELRRVSRRYHGGSFKLEPGSLSKMRIPKKLHLAD